MNVNSKVQMRPTTSKQ